jgi:hypothetical protein
MTTLKQPDQPQWDPNRLTGEEYEENEARLIANRVAYHKKRKARESYRRNKESKAKSTRKWVENNRVRLREAKRKYYKENKHIFVLSQLRRKYELLLADEDKPMVREIYQHRERLNSIFGEGTFHVDHTIPVSKGGEHSPANLQVVPAKWNLEKHNQHSNRWEVPFKK